MCSSKWLLSVSFRASNWHYFFQESTGAYKKTNSLALRNSKVLKSGDILNLISSSRFGYCYDRKVLSLCKFKAIVDFGYLASFSGLCHGGSLSSLWLLIDLVDTWNPLDVTRSNTHFKLSDSSISIRFTNLTKFDEITTPPTAIPLQLFWLQNYRPLMSLANTNTQLPGESKIFLVSLKFFFIHHRQLYTERCLTFSSQTS